MRQVKQMQLRGIDTQTQLTRAMEGRDEKRIEQENEKGLRTVIQEKAEKITE